MRGADIAWAAATTPDRELAEVLGHEAKVALAREAVEVCRMCALSSSRTRAVPWEGTGVPVLMVGEGPGADEDVEGRPFVGRAGRLLDELAGVAGLKRGRTSSGVGYGLANVVCCRPPNNKFDEAVKVGAPGACRVHLEAAIDLSDAWIVVCVGTRAVEAFDAPGSAAQMRGRFWWGPEFRLYTAIYHPAFLLRGAGDDARTQVVQTLANVRATVEGLRSLPPLGHAKPMMVMAADDPSEAVSSHLRSRGWVMVWSELLADRVLVTRDEFRGQVPEAARSLPVYTVGEVARMPRDPSYARRVHAAKLMLGAAVAGG